MKALHCITGVPRSGSTLLCNIMNQNPAFHATDTSPIPEMLGTLSRAISGNAEIQGLLNVDADGAQDAIRRMLRAMIDEWYAGAKGTVFDKSRGWSYQGLLAADLYPKAKFIVTTRDLRNVFSSIEKQHRKAPFFDTAASPIDKTVLQRANVMLSPEGMIGTCAVGIQDLMVRMPKKVHVVRYEAFTLDPKAGMNEIYDFLAVKPFKHKFDNVENVSREPDHLYLNKFPHEGCGKVEKTNRNAWQEFLSPDLAQMIHERYPDYNKHFGY